MYISLSTYIISQILTVNEFVIVVVMGHVWVYVRKREGFERGRMENEFERKRA